MTDRRMAQAARLPRRVQRRATPHPELSFLCCRFEALLAEARVALDISPALRIHFTIVPGDSLACITLDKLAEGECTVLLHAILNRPDTPRPVLEHIAMHELLHLKIPSREVDGKRRSHPPEFGVAERDAVPWCGLSFAWIYLACGHHIEICREEEGIRVKRGWKRRYEQPFPEWDHVCRLGERPGVDAATVASGL
ncbi:hypothetical protein F2Q65_17350 [Thiohalocapsa marina]|uniref:SprT family zinc-dependent metalloprotease n=1 Tax=Thiohalocapsa marina TaxID=424902 RepID=A0A5M8FCY4_9GAMM|nr:hypothetical protein [Thiohalocapsa marina]KAA6182738.1 hypothetical protein F2Q65_17350 [Thiohalocapsa marina]